MEGIALPVRVSDGAGGQLQVAASIDLSVNLANPEARGIHMSRLYLQLQAGLAREAITPAGLRHLLQESIASQSGLASQARACIGLFMAASNASRGLPFLRSALGVTVASTLPSTPSRRRLSSARPFLGRMMPFSSIPGYWLKRRVR